MSFLLTRCCRQVTLSICLSLLSSLVTFAQTLEPVTLQLKWSHAFQFAGYYAAQEKGYYREAGLAVTIQEAKPGVDAIQSVLSGRATYGVGTSNLLLARKAQQPVVVLGVIFQHSPLVLISRGNRASQSIHDLLDKKVMIEPQSDELLAFLAQEGIPMSRLTMVQHSHNTQDLIDGKVDAISAYVTNEPFFLDRVGFAYQTYTPRASGIDFYGDNFFTTQSEIKRNPAQVEAFRLASLRGWQYAMAHPEEIADLIIAKYSQQHPREFYLFEAQRMAQLMQTELIQIGYMNPGRWRHIADAYAGLGLLPRDFSLDGFLYDPQARTDFAPFYLPGALLIIVSATALYILRSNRRLARALAASNEAQLALGVSEVRHRLLADHATDVIWTMNLQGRFTYVSPSVERLRGYTSAEVMQQTMEQALCPSSIPIATESLGKSIAAMSVGLPFIDFRGELEQPCKNGSTVWTEAITSSMRDSDGKFIGILGVSRDITERKRLEQEVQQLAFYDPLTHLPNRRLFNDRLSQTLARAKRAQTRMALMFIDLDKFKPINDQYGHEAGDWVLHSVARRIESCLRSSDTAARVGGDEFLVLLPDVQTGSDALAVAEKIRIELERPFVTPSKLSLRVSSSIGIAIYPDHANTEQDLLRLGDRAMYQAKRSGGNTVELSALSDELEDTDDINSVGGHSGQSIVRLTWKAVFACGQQTIDNEHRELLRLSNVLLGKVVMRDEEPEQFDAAFDALLAHVVEHFAHEEAILHEHAYEHLQEHAQIHQSLVVQALKLRHPGNQAAGVSVGGLVDFLVTEVVARHMLTEDRKFAALFADKNSL